MLDKPIEHSGVNSNSKKSPENTGMIVDFTEALREKTYSALAEKQHPEAESSAVENNCDISPTTETELRNIIWADTTCKIMDFVMKKGIEIDPEE